MLIHADARHTEAVLDACKAVSTASTAYYGGSSGTVGNTAAEENPSDQPQTAEANDGGQQAATESNMELLVRQCEYQWHELFHRTQYLLKLDCINRQPQGSAGYSWGVCIRVK